MAIDNRGRGAAAGGRHDPVHRERYRPVRLIGLLLVLQAAGLTGLVLFQFSRVQWRGIEAQELSKQTAESLACILFMPTAVLALLAALSFFIFSRKGWVLAALSQGLGLGVCLWLYSEVTPVYVYPIMVYCIFIVLYLNSRTVRALFHSGQHSPGEVERP